MANANTLTLRNKTTSPIADYRVQLGRPCVKGEISGAPKAEVGGVALQTQADVKLRWGDGSAKHAALSFIVPSLPVGETVVKFINQAQPPPATPLTKEQMLAFADFNPTITLTRAGVVQTASARAMLTDGNYIVWASGPLSTTIILADHSVERKYDFGFEAKRPIRPIFHATFWPASGTVKVRAIWENTNTEAMQDVLCDVVVRNGTAEVYRQAAVTHKAGTRCTRSFWIGAAPQVAVDVDHNKAYLSDTRLFPQFDLTLPAATEAENAAAYAAFLTRDRALYGSGGWVKSTGATGGRGDLGLYTSWQMLWLFSGGDYRRFEIVATMADLACAWAQHAREGNPDKKFDQAQTIPALGRPVSVYARPTLWLFDTRGNQKPADKVTITPPILIGNGWSIDGAHQPEPYSILYTLTADPFYLEQLQFWSSANVLGYDPGYKGPAPSGVIVDQQRGDAWVMRSRGFTADLSPDGTPEKLYFTKLMDDAIAYWEGEHDIRGTKFEGTTFWKFAQSKTLRVSPLHFMNESGEQDDTLVPGTQTSTASLWQQYMTNVVFGHLVFDRGYLDLKTVLSWCGANLIGQFKDHATYDPLNAFRYRCGVKDGAGVYFQTWAATLICYKTPAPPPINNDVGDGYWMYGHAGLTFLLGEPGGQEAYEWMRVNAYDPRKSLVAKNPKWALVPRIGGVIPPDPPSEIDLLKAKIALLEAELAAAKAALVAAESALAVVSARNSAGLIAAEAGVVALTSNKGG